MNVSEMLKNVKGICKPITNIDTFIRRALNRGQHVINSKSPQGGWFFLRQYRFPLSVTASTAAYSLSHLVDTSKIINFWDEDNDVYINPMTEQAFRRRVPNPSGDTGTSYLYRLKGYSPVQNQPSSASVITIVSSSASDTTQSVTIQGLNGSSVYIQETVDLNGTTNAVSTASFSKIMGLSKSATTVGSVAVTSNSGGVTNVVIAPKDRFLSHPVVEFYTIPSETQTLYYDFTLKLSDIYDDDDCSLIPEKYHDVIELYAISKTFESLKNTEQKMIAMQEFELRIKDMEKENYQPQGIKTFESIGDYNSHNEPRLPSNYPRV